MVNGKRIYEDTLGTSREGSWTVKGNLAHATRCSSADHRSCRSQILQDAARMFNF